MRSSNRKVVSYAMTRVDTDHSVTVYGANRKRKADGAVRLASTALQDHWRIERI